MDERLASSRRDPSPVTALQELVRRNHRTLLLIGLLGVAAVLLVSVPGNPVFDLSQRRHQLAGAVLSHASVAVILVALSPSREHILQALVRISPGVWLAIAGLASATFLGAWVVLFPSWHTYAVALTRESGPLEPVQAGLYVVAAWLAGRCAAAAVETDQRRFYRVARAVCVWLVLEEVQYLGLVETSVGGRIEGVWVRSLHDLVALGDRVPGLLAALAVLAVLGAVAAVWYIGARGVLREARSVAAVPAMAAAGVLALSQVLDHDKQALASYAVALTYRLEEPFELVAALLLAVALVIKVREVTTGEAVTPAARRHGD